ncbi:MAG: Bax inhibitor-1/YccA family protein [Arcanobacterium sp.]|nr:Bax inhibitor-1/YccA family protein [Arcanobacterium sp.]MDY5588471.1 Bax inhibitor-1/YccA family protein [Arcanobacterium sp.]
MSNPVMSKNPYFRNTEVRPNQFGTAQSGTQYQTDYAQQYGSPAYQQQFGSQFNAQETMFQAQSAAGNDFTAAYSGADVMSYRDAMNKTGILLGITVVVGVLTVALLGANPSAMMGLAMISTIAAFVVGLVIAFKRMVPAGLAVAYAALEGVALGGITGAIDMIYPGVAMQAILGTTAVVGVTLLLHYSGKVRTTSKGMKYVLIVALAGIVFGIVNMVIAAFTGNNLYFSNPTLGILVGAVMIFVAAYMLINDFESVQYAVANGAPRAFAWTAAIGIVMTILWIYVEVLRIAAILADNR